MYRPLFDRIWRDCRARPGETPPVEVRGKGVLPSAFAVSDLAAAAVSACGAAVAELVEAATGTRPTVMVDRALCCQWFKVSIQPLGWALPPAWDAVAGDYRAADGWIRLHTNAAHHRAAALRVLGVAAEREAVAEAVADWTAEALEQAIVEADGCAAAMRSQAGWAAHPQGSAVAAEPVVARTPAPRSGVRTDIDPLRPLGGVRVLDLTRVLAGPVATRLLASFGAEVLRIDPPGWHEPSLEPDMTLGKRCARLELRDPAGRETLRALLAGADVLIHGYRPGALERLGFGEAKRQRIRPGLIDVSLDAYGWTGPWAGRRGFDSLVQMSAGIADAGMRWAASDRPTPLPVQALDHATGYIMAAAAITGLTDRLQGGSGCIARASLAQTAALLTSVDDASDELARDADEADFAPDLEITEWGPARRLRPPLQVGSAAMRWDRPARSLGSASTRWSAG